MPHDLQLEGVVRVIQLAVAPVFLLSGIGSLLGVLVARLSRVIDHARRQEAKLPDAGPPQRAALQDELATLSMRARLTNRAITMCVAAALFVCLVIVTLFAGALAEVHVGVVVSLEFLAAMVALVVALVFFQREVFVATRTLRIGVHPKT